MRSRTSSVVMAFIVPTWLVRCSAEIPFGDNRLQNKHLHLSRGDTYGKSRSISSTSLLVRTGAPGPRVTAGNPLTGSITILAFRFFVAVNGSCLRFCAFCFLLERLLSISTHPSISEIRIRAQKRVPESHSVAKLLRVPSR